MGVTKHEESHLLRKTGKRKNDLAVIARRGRGWKGKGRGRRGRVGALPALFARPKGIPHCSERESLNPRGSGRRGNDDVSGQKCIAQRGSRRVKGESVPTSLRGRRTRKPVVADPRLLVEEVDGGGEGEGKEPHSWAHSLSVPRVGPLSRVRESQSQYLRFLPTVDGDHLFPGA